MKLLFFLGILALFTGLFFIDRTTLTETNQFVLYKIDWNKSYPNKEVEEYRMTIFYENLA